MTGSRYPTRIRLEELSQEGDQFSYSRESGELNETLKDLVGQHPYRAEVFLRPMGNVYEIRCEVEGTMDLICSRCGRPVKRSLKEQSHELLVVEEIRPRNAQNSNGHRNSGENGPFCNYLENSLFDIGEFVHEQLAASEPFVVECGESNCESLMETFQASKDSEEDEGKTKPFAGLKDLLLN